MKKPLVIALAAVALAILVGLAVSLQGADDRQENPNIRRGKELLSINEPDAAVRELRIALKAEPRNRDAKALLLIALLRTEQTLPGWYEAQILFERLRFLEASELSSLEGVPELKKRLTQARQELYDKGLDTKDTAELWDLTAHAATYSFQNADDEMEKDHSAFVLALHGRQEGLAFLVDRLKSEKAVYIPGLLTRLPESAEAPLMQIATDRENLGRGRALDALANLRERQASEKLFAEGSMIRGFLPTDLAEEFRDRNGYLIDGDGLTRDQALYGVNLREDEKAAPLRVHWVVYGDDGGSRVLVLQAFDDTKGQTVTRFYGFSEGELTNLSLEAPIEALDRLATEGPIVAAEPAGAGVRLVQIGRGSVPVMREMKRRSYAKGQRVRVRAISRDGVVAGTDEFGLLTVILDEPHRGVKAMDLTPNAVRGLEPVLEQRIGRRVYEGHIDGQRFTLAQPSDELLPL